MAWSLYTNKTLIHNDPTQTTFVYKAWDELAHRPVALKEIHTNNPDLIPQIRMEAECQQALALPTVCEVYATKTWEEAGQWMFIIAMEWLDRDLHTETQERMKQGKEWTEEELWKLVQDISGTLAEAQRRSYCHRDVKPMNIFYVADSVFKISDFGSAKNMEHSSLHHSIAGTPQYLSPLLMEAYTKFLTDGLEVPVEHNPYKSDVYSLGLTVVYLANPASFGKFQYPDYVKDVVEMLNVSEELNSWLKWMLRVEESLRPDFLELEARLRSRFGPVIPTADAIISELNSASGDLSIALSQAFRSTFRLAATVEISCSACKSRMSLANAKQMPWNPSELLCESCHSQVKSLDLREDIRGEQMPPSIGRVQSWSEEEGNTCLSVKSSENYNELETTLGAESQPVVNHFSMRAISRPPASDVKDRRDVAVWDAYPKTEEDPEIKQYKCRVCGNCFDSYPKQRWQIRMAETQFREDCEKICSETCFERHRSEEKTGQMHVFSENCINCNGDTAHGFLLSCKRHCLCLTCEKPNFSHYLAGFECTECSEMPPFRVFFSRFGYFSIGFGDQSYCKIDCLGSEVVGKNEAWKLLPISFFRKWRDSDCHFCLRPIFASPKAFFLVCGQTLSLVCSPECFRSSMINHHHICPRCKQLIHNYRITNIEDYDRAIRSAANPNREFCFLCRVRAKDVLLACGHGYCKECMTEFIAAKRGRMFHCPYCGLRKEVLEYSDLLRE